MKTWKGLIVFCISFLCCWLGQSVLNFACGPQIDPYDYSVTFFHNNLTGDQAYQPFYYNEYLFLNDDNEPEKEDFINAREWSARTGKSAKEIHHVMYDLPSQEDFILSNDCLNGHKRLPKPLRKNRFIRYLRRPSNQHLLQYYVFVKKMERVTNEITNAKWDAVPRDSSLMHKYALSAFRSAKKEQDPFLKLRYYYQAQRLMHYSGNRLEAGKIYDRYIIKFHSQSHVMGWAMALKAGEEWGVNDDHAAYLMSRVFDRYPERRIQAFHDFHSIGVKAETVLRYARNNDERANIYAMIGFHQPQIGLSALKMVYRYQPSSKLLIVLLAREINKLEKNYIDPRIQKKLNYYYFDNLYYDWGVKTTPAQFKAYIQPLKLFCLQLGSDKRSANSSLGYIAAAYLDWMQNNPDQGLQTLSTLDEQKLNGHFYDQLQMVKLLLLSKKIKYLDNTAEQSLLPSLQWLDHKMEQETKPDKNRLVGSESLYVGYDLRRFSVSGRDFYQKILAPLYLKQHDTTKAGLAFFKSAIDTNDLTQYQVHWGKSILPDLFQNYLHSKNLMKIISYKFHTPEDTYLCLLSNRLKTVKRDFLYDLAGTAYLREHNYSAAVKIFKKMRPLTAKSYFGGLSLESTGHLLADPFTDKLNDYPRVGGKKRYTKLMFAEAMAKLQRQIKANPKNAADTYFKMATGLYNTSLYGNSWYLITYSWGVFDWSRAPQFYYDDDYLKLKNAEELFLMARQTSKDPEFKARCTFMAAKCRGNQTSSPTKPESTENEMEYKRRLIEYKRNLAISKEPGHKDLYFTDLKQHYSNTRFFKIAISECSYFRDFLHIEKPKPQKRKSI